MRYEAYLNVIDEQEEMIRGISDAIWDLAELPYAEFQSSKILCDVLEKQGFTVKRGVADIPTAFTATYGTEGPSLGVLAEFDAVVKGKDKSARKELEEACEVITEINIVEGDALKYLTNDKKPIVFVKWRAGDDNSRGTFSFGVTPYYFDTMVGEAKKGDLFAIRDDLPRSPQYPFYEIGKIREFMKGIEV